MSAKVPKLKSVSLALLCLLIIVAIALLNRPAGSAQEGGKDLASYSSSEGIATEEGSDPKDAQATEGSEEEAHAANCAHCVVKNGNDSTMREEVAQPVLQTQPGLDPIFKRISRERILFSRSDFDFLKGSQLGQAVNFELAGRNFSGEVALVREGENTRSYAVEFPEGDLMVSVNRIDEFTAHFLFEGDSRVVEIAGNKRSAEDTEKKIGNKTALGVLPSSVSLVASEVSVSDVLCAPKGAVYPLSAPQAVSISGLAEPGVEEYSQPSDPVAAISLTSEADSGHVLYLNFDGEVVTGDAWNVNSGISTINALPAPRADDDEYVTAIWERVVEDFAPFNITVTTSRAIYDATPSDQRLQAIITPTSAVAPTAGGVAFLNSYATNLSDIVWVFNLSEYACASTVSHEAGHAFGLRHDGTSLVEYYPGHNGSYEPGWGAIMGAPFIGPSEEVDQWSIGEYADANNFEDDIAIISNSANGFGFIPDDYADIFTGGGGLDPGILNNTGPNEVGGSGIISKKGDKDLFRFSAAFSGQVSITVSPIDVESSDAPSKGANLAVATRLLNSAGSEIATGVNVGDVFLTSLVEASVGPGIYYLEVDGAGRGTDPSGGFSDYASVGQYEIVGDLPTQPLSITGSEPDRNENGNIIGPGKLDQTVLPADLDTSISNGTDFGYSYPSNGPFTHTFLLKNTGLTDLENMTFSLASGVDFEIVSTPGTTIPAGVEVEMQIAYDPLEDGENGLDDDTVIINYESTEPVTFEFAISGLSTPSSGFDNYEPNNNHKASQATDLNGVENVWLSDYKGKAFFSPASPYDFYTIDGVSGALVTVEVSYNATEEGPITFELFNINGGLNLLGSTTAEDGRILFLVPEHYSSKQSKLYIRASHAGTNTVRNPYDLRWNITLSSGDDDFYEENDTQSEAFDLTGASSSRLSEYLGKGVLNDEDWYKIEIPADPFVRLFYVRADFVHAEGNIDIEIIPAESDSFAYLKGQAGVDEDYEVLTYSQGVATEDFADNFTPVGNVAIMGVEPGTYYVRVTGDFAGNEYDLVVEAKQDDNYEIVDEFEETENDTEANPTELGEAIIGKFLSEVDGMGTNAAYGENATKENFSNGVDRDWFRFNVPADTVIGSLLFEYESFAGGTMFFRIFDSDFNLLATNARNDLSNLTDDIDAFSISQPGGNVFYVSVTPSDEISGLSGYDFRVQIDETPPINEDLIDDNYEENDNFTEAYDLSDNAGFWLSAENGYGVNLDPDWYEITVPENATQLVIESVFDGNLGTMELYLSRKNGATLFRAPYPVPEPDPDAEENDEDEEPEVVNSRSIVWEYPEPGSYNVTVLGQNNGNSYNLFWGYTLIEDAYEENDVQANATDLRGHEKQLLNKLDGPGVQADEDWYRITAGADTDQLRVISRFTDAEGDIDVELYNTAGFRVARSTTSTDDESITLLNPDVGDYFVRVYFGNAKNEYDLWWGAFTDEELDNIEPDAYEIDNSSGVATTLPIFTSLEDLEGLATQTDEDWWEVDIAENNSGFLLECTFTHADGDIDFEIVAPDGSITLRADSQTDNEIVNYNAPLPGGTYFIRVYGANLGNTYDLFWVDKRDDAFEENDSIETAADIEDFKQLRLSAEDVPTQGDDDWYRVVAEEVDSVLVLELTYTKLEGSVYLELYDSGENLLASDLTDDDLKYLQYTLPDTGDYFIRVFGDDAYNEYDLFWNARPEDAFEENDNEDDAYVISGDEGVELEGALFDEDWFELDPPYGVVTVELTLDFNPAFGDIDITVFNQFGEPVALIPSVLNTQAVEFEVNPFDGETYIQLSAPGGYYGNSYTMSWVSVTRDIDEDNDTLATATDLSFADGIPLSESGGFDTSADEDWFSFVPTGTNLSIYCQFMHADGDIDLELVDQNGDPIERAISDTDDESIMTSVTPGDTYYIRVFGETAGNPYDLVWISYDSDDAFEENDAFADATAHNSASEYIYREDLVQLDDDWYEFEVEVGENRVLAELLPFSRIDAMVLELYDDSEVLIDSIATAEGENRLESTTLTAGFYYLKVKGRELGGKYALVWSSGNEDNYEENDSLGDAYNLSTSPETDLSLIDGPGKQYDEDWYSLNILSDDSLLEARLDYFINHEDLSFELYDADGTLLQVGSGSASDRSISATGLEAGVYYLKVDGPGLGSQYELEWKFFADDAYEDNDAFAESHDLGSSATGTLSPIDGLGVRGADDDYFSLSVPEGYVTLDVTCIFAHAAGSGNIKLELFDEDGTSLDLSDTNTDDEEVSISVNPNGGDTIYILVSEADSSGTTYDLTWTFGLEDLYEDNETIGTATDIMAQEGSLLSESMGFATQGDSDFYLVTLPVGSLTLNVDVLFTHSLGNIDVNVYDSVPTLIATANSATDNETLAVPVSTAGGDYYIEVTGANTNNYYDLIWSVEVDDPYEENDADTATYDLSSENGVRLSAGLGLGKQYDEDWYSFPTPAGDVSLSVLIDEFSILDGDINLEVYDAADNLLASSTEGSFQEEIQLPVDPAGDSFKVRVFGDDNGNSYDLIWSTSKVDLYEENNFVEDFYDLADSEGLWISTVNGSGTQADDDWYQIVVSTGATKLTIDCAFTHAEGDIDLELYRLDPTAEGEKTTPGEDQRKPTLMHRVTSTDDNEEIVDFDVTGKPGIYFIRVYFGNQGNIYDLRWFDEDAGDNPVVDPTGDDVFLDEEWFFGENSNALLDVRLRTPLANTDGDAFQNWAEFALNLDVGIPDTVVVDNSQKEIEGETYFTISFVRNAEAVARGYRFFVDESHDLNFDGSHLAVEDAVVPLDDGLERVTFRSSKEISEIPNCFFRIRVEPPEKSY